MPTIDTNLLVLGGGPGGYSAAFLAADRGIRTTLVDAAPKPGGTCLHVGCIPSKALLHAAHLIHGVHDAAEFGIRFAKPEIDLGVLRTKKGRIIDVMASSLLDLCKKRGVTYIAGRGVFADPHRVQVGDSTVTFRRAIVATGSIPATIPALGGKHVLDSTAALQLDAIPKSLLVVGGGYIGLELGTIYASLSSEVTVVEMTPGLLPGVDADLVQPLHARLKTIFRAIHVGTKVAKSAETAASVTATFEGDGAPKEATFEKVLVAVGRRPNSANLGLDKIGIALDPRGFVKVDGQRRTNVPHVFAIGDVAGEPMLAHKAAHEGKLVAEVLAGDNVVWDKRCIPAVVFTDPEIAWAGLTEIEARKAGTPVTVAKFRWLASGRATTLGRTDGLTKILVDPATDRVLGVGIVGAGAGELIGEAVAAIEMGATAKDLALCVHPHPTLTETLAEAAESLHGLSSHLYHPKKKV
ncbi:MAG TPA: dihydrolipoyl dehydrogenase [Gemmataceae bacterium]|jgi:dihydrolipoamide dehydrogenase|nr:dihydrolipoyl dehydrogenase [Gemmataceae bacterium]